MYYISEPKLWAPYSQEMSLALVTKYPCKNLATALSMNQPPESLYYCEYIPPRWVDIVVHVGNILPYNSAT